MANIIYIGGKFGNATVTSSTSQGKPLGKSKKGIGGAASVSAGSTGQLTDSNTDDFLVGHRLDYGIYQIRCL